MSISLSRDVNGLLYDAHGEVYRLEPGQVEVWLANHARAASPDELDQLREVNADGPLADAAPGEAAPHVRRDPSSSR